MARGKVYDYERIDRRKEAQDDWYLQRRREIREEDDALPSTKKTVQPKLEISQPGDQHEQEADVIAKKVAGGGNAGGNKITPVNNIVQTKSEDNVLQAPPEFSSSLNNSQGNGQPLNDSTKTEMESKMGADFSGVKIHTGSEAHEMSDSINAKAFTHGQDIYFKQGNYNTNSQQGKELLAHELVHTQQQGNGVSRKVQRVVEIDKDKVDRVASTVAEILGFGYKRVHKLLFWQKKQYVTDPDQVNADPENAIKAYRYIHTESGLNDDEIGDLYDRYPGLVYEMDENLPVEFRETDEFGFFKGVSEDEKGKLLDMLRNDETWKDAGLLNLTLKMVVNGLVDPKTGRIDPLVTDIILDKQAFIKVELTKTTNGPQPEGYTKSEEILTANGFYNGIYTPKTTGEVSSKGYSYGRSIARFIGTPFRRGALGYSFGDRLKSTFSGLGWASDISKKLKVKGASLYDLQKSFAGTMGGFNFQTEFDKKGRAKKNSKVGKVDLELDNKNGTLDIFSQSLPFASANYQGSDYTFQSDAGYFTGVHMYMTWPVLKKGEKPSGEMQLKILPESLSGMKELVMNNILITMPKETFGIGSLTIKGLKFSLTQSIADPAAFEGYKAITSGVYLLLDVISVLQAAVTQTLNRFTIPGNDDARDARTKGKSLLEKFLAEKGLETYDLRIEFSSLEITNFVYVDEDYTRDNSGNITNPDAKVKTSVIKNISAGQTTITAITSGVKDEDKNALSAKKIELLAATKDRDNAKRDVQMLTIRKAELEKELTNTDLKKAERKRLEKELQTVSADLLTKNDSVAKNQKAVEDLQKEISTLQGGMKMDVSLEATDFKTDNAELLDEIGNSMLSGYAESVTGLGSASVKTLSFKTSYNQFGTSGTSLGLTGLQIPELSINCIYYATKDYSFILQADRAILCDVFGNVTIGFKDQPPSQNAPGNDQYADKQAIDSLSKEIEAAKTEYATLDKNSDAAKQKAELIAAQENDLAGKQKAYDDKYGLVASIYLETLTIPTAQLYNLQIDTKSATGSNTVKFPTDQPVLMQNLEACDLMIGFTPDGIALGPGKNATRGRAELMSLTVPAGTTITNKDIQGNPQIGISLSEIIAGQLSIDFLNDGVMNYSLGTLTGGGTMTQFGQGGDPDRQSKINLPGSTGDVPLMSGTIDKDKITTKVNLPKIEIPFIDYASDTFSILVPDTGNVSVIEGITIDAEAEKNPDKKAKNPFTAITLKEVVINSITAYGMTLKKDKITVNVPAKFPSTILGLYLKNLRMKSDVKENEVVWDKTAVMENGKEKPLEVGLQKMNFMQGLSLTIKDKLSATLTSATSDAIDFDIFDSGNFTYDINNLDAAGEFWMKNKEGQKTADLKGKIDTKHLAGDFKKELIGTGDDARFKYTITGTDLDIPLISSRPLNVVSNQYEFHVPQSAKNDTSLQDIKGSYVMTLLAPSVAERREYKKKTDDAKIRSKTAETAKERKDYKEESETSAPWDINLHINDLSIDKMQSYGLHFIARSETKVKASDQVKSVTNTFGFPETNYESREYEKTIMEFKLRDDASATMNKLQMTDFDIHIPKEQGKSISFTGNATLGDATHTAVDVGKNTFSINTAQNLIFQESFGTKFTDEQRSSKSNNITNAFSISKISFGGSTEGEFDFTIDDPKIFFPEDKNKSGSNIQSSSQIGWTGVSLMKESYVTFEDVQRDLPVLEAGQIVVSRRQKKKEDNVTPETDADGNIVYETITKIVKPKLQDIRMVNVYGQKNDDKYVPLSEGDPLTDEIIIGGELDGTLILKKGKSNFKTPYDETNYSGEEDSIILSTEKPTDKLTFTRMEANFTKWPTEEMSDADKKVNNEYRKSDDYEAITDYKPEENNDFNFLDQSKGDVTINLFGMPPITVKIQDVDETYYNASTTIVSDGMGNGMPVTTYQDSGKKITGTGYIDISDLLYQIQQVLKSRQGKEITENPYDALTNISATQENNNLVLLVMGYGFWPDTSAHVIFCPDYSKNVLDNGAGKKFVRLSALMNYQANKPATDFYITGTDSDKDALARDQERLKKSGALNLSLTFDATVDMSKLVTYDKNNKVDVKATNKQRGMLNMFQGNQSINISGTTTIDNSLNAAGKPLFKSSTTLNKMTLHEFRYTVPSSNKYNSDLVVSGKQIDLDSLKIDLANANADSQRYKTTNLSITGLQIEAKNKPQKLLNERK